MEIKAKVQRDYLLTEASISLPADITKLDEILKASKTNGKLIVLYNQGAVQGVNIEQRTKVPESKAEGIRSALEVKDKEL